MTRDFTLSEYGCVRYRHRPWARRLASLAPTAFDDDGNVSAELGSRISQEVLYPLLDSAKELEQPSDWPSFQANALREASTAGIHTAWLHFGRQIFHLSPALISEFRHTDVDATTFGGLSLPYRAFFIHFGVQDDLPLHDESRDQPEFVDGAYVFQDAAGGLTFELTLSRLGAPSLLPGAQVTIDPDLLSIGAEEALRAAVDRALAKNTSHEDKSASPLTAASHTEAAAFLRQSADTLIRSTRLLANSLFYLSEYEDDQVTEVEPSAPESDRIRYSASTGARQRKLTQAIFAEGFSVINFVGRALEAEHIRGTGAELRSAHWRRGHWRDQRHGPQLSLVKRIRIRPVLVRRDLGEPDVGHVYQVPGRDA